ncbi:MAG: hypothetical protein E7330_08580 [Clostridiales bacterium]|nr:hypothetical protein [Clostridiales bacterium]
MSEMANNTYGSGPQLPSYMKKQAKANIDASAARKQKETETAKKTASSASRSRAAAAGTARRSTAAGTTSVKPASRPAQKAAPAQRSAPRTNAATSKKTAAAKKTQSSSSKSRKRKTKKKMNTKRLMQVLGIAAAGLVAVVGLVWFMNRDTVGNVPTDIEGIMNTKKTFRDGVKLIGVDVSGMTPEEATGLVKYAAEKKLEKVAVSVALDDATWTFGAKDLGMSYDLTDMFADGLAFGRSDDSEVQDVFAAGAGEFDAKYTWDRSAIEFALTQLELSINKEATQPYAEPIADWASEERFNYIAGEEGRALNVAATADDIEYALRTGDFTATVEPVINAVLPELTIEDVKLHTQYIAEYTTKFSAARDDEIKQNRLFNIQKAADIINANTILPGTEWSFNTVVGPRTYELGWKGANGISGGKEYTVQAGGGICQPSTTLYNALLGANAEIVDRRAHSIPSDYVDVGLDATVDTRGIDFVFRNNTEYPMYIFARVQRVEGSSSRHTITVYVYGEPLPEGVTYKSRSDIIEVMDRSAETIYTEDPTIPTGYQKETVVQHEGYIAEAYLDKYVNGELAESKLLYQDKYKGNPAEISIGTGPALKAGEPVPEGLVPVGTPPTPASSRA